MNLFDVVILSLVEGLTEFLPVSSTGHLIVLSELLGLSVGSFGTSFNIAVQLGAILAIVLLYWRSVWWDHRLAGRIVLAFLPTALVGLIFYPLIKEHLLVNSELVAIMFLLGGLALIGFELWHARRAESAVDLSEVSTKQALIIGLFQTVAIIPGVSRSAATIVGGLWLGLKRQVIVEFSFLLAVPTMAAAVSFDLLQSAPVFTAAEFGWLLLGFILSFIFAWLSVKFLLIYITRYSFIPFGVYRIVVGIILLAFLL